MIVEKLKTFVQFKKKHEEKLSEEERLALALKFEKAKSQKIVQMFDGLQ